MSKHTIINADKPCGLSKAEIERQIVKELRHIDLVKQDIENCKYDIKATRKTISFWKKQLKLASK